jgi:hypothetical protein
MGGMGMSPDLTAKMNAVGARLRAKKHSTLMAVIAMLVRPFNASFMETYWTTIGRTIYYPLNVAHPIIHVDIIEHELVHIEQWNKYWLWFWFSYLFVPFPIFVAWYRWRWEREAYLVDLNKGLCTIDAVVARLWHEYGWCWPRTWMRKWFMEQKRQTI